MHLGVLDWTVVAAYLAASLAIGALFRRRSGGSTEDYFVSGRRASWWLAGTSMVATTFAADTPLVVAGLVYSQGIAGNWLWWSFLLSGMMTVFLFARLWHRAELLTDVEFAELRYGGRPAAFLRGFRAIYLGLLINALILGWVTKAMTTIVAVALAGSPALAAVGRIVAPLGAVWSGNEGAALAVCVFFVIPLTGFYVALGGLWGVLWTDLFQFVLKMAVVVAVAWYGVAAAGGMASLLVKLQALSVARGASSSPVALLPDFTAGLAGEAAWTLPVLTFTVYLAVQWWASWYPGAEPGGGGFVAQRIFSARSEREGVLAVLWFNVAHYAVRPWPWILTGLAAIVLYPNLDNPENGYLLVLTNHLPAALRGVALAGFLAAFMSTVATQLNWGASYLVGDLYRRFIRRQAPERHYVTVSRLATVLLVAVGAWISVMLGSIAGGWLVVLEIGAGTGAVYLLRWYWWRVNAWSEIAAMTTSLVVTLLLHWQGLWLRLLGQEGPFVGTASVVFAKTALVTALATTAAWVAITLSTPPESDAVLRRFYRKVRPDVRGWRTVAAANADIPETRDLERGLAGWVTGCAMVYLALFGTGKLLLREPGLGLILLAASAACAWQLSRQMRFTARQGFSPAREPR